jgi:FkbM family methyltransferase
MTVASSSWRLSLVARLCRFFPPGVSGVFLRLYPIHLARRENPWFQVRSSLADVSFRMDEVDAVSLIFAIRGFFDWQNVVIAGALCTAGDTIVEVGANLGTETLLFSRIVGPTGRVVAFEPVPDNMATLRRQIALNRITNIDLRGCAVSDHAGKLRFVLGPSRDNTGQGRLAGGAGDDGTGGARDQVESVIEVETVVLDELHASGALPSPRLIAIDVQGAELLVLRGADRILRETRPAVIFEVERELLAEHGLRPADLSAYLKERGYLIRRISKWGLVDDRPEHTDAQNWLALPQPGAEQAARRISRRIRRAAAWPLIPGLNPAVIRRSATALEQCPV